MDTSLTKEVYPREKTGHPESIPCRAVRRGETRGERRAGADAFESRRRRREELI
jgi:hypothetical protein